MTNILCLKFFISCSFVFCGTVLNYQNHLYNQSLIKASLNGESLKKSIFDNNFYLGNFQTQNINHRIDIDSLLHPFMKKNTDLNSIYTFSFELLTPKQNVVNSSCLYIEDLNNKKAYQEKLNYNPSHFVACVVSFQQEVWTYVINDPNEFIDDGHAGQGYIINTHTQEKIFIQALTSLEKKLRATIRNYPYTFLYYEIFKEKQEQLVVFIASSNGKIWLSQSISQSHKNIATTIVSGILLRNILYPKERERRL